MARREENRVLRDVLELVRGTHWIKQRYRMIDENGKRCGCLVGLVAWECGERIDGYGTNEPLRAHVLNRIARAINAKRKRPMSIEEWNDRTATNRAEVEDVIQRALVEIR